MRTVCARLLLGMTIALLAGGCALPRLPTPVGTARPDSPSPGPTYTRASLDSPAMVPTSTPRPTSEADPNWDAVAAHLQEAMRLLNSLDLAAALAEVDQAERLLADTSPDSPEYILVLRCRATLYSSCGRLDEAEATLLKGTGIPDDEIAALTNSRQPLTREQYLAIADELQGLVAQDDRSGYHVALSLIYNVLGDTESMRAEQQRAMDVSVDDDSTLSLAMGLYQVRGRKVEMHAVLQEQKQAAASDPANPAKQLELGYAYYLVGWFPEAQSIADRGTAALDAESDGELHLGLLFLQMNLALAQGRYDAMKGYEEEILRIDPHALDEDQPPEEVPID